MLPGSALKFKQTQNVKKTHLESSAKVAFAARVIRVLSLLMLSFTASASLSPPQLNKAPWHLTQLPLHSLQTENRDFHFEG